MVCLLGLVCALGPGTAAARLPSGFLGVVPQGALQSRDFARMEGVVGSLRVAVFWPAVEPAAGEPDLAPLDSIVARGAEHGVRVEPFVYGSPSWLTRRWNESPMEAAGGAAAWSRFLATLVDRYGPGGSLWDGVERPLPVREWQIWNEPNFPLFWQSPSAVAYARLLRRSAAAIRNADSRAIVVAAGLAPIEHEPPPWRYLASLLRAPGVRGALDIAALHPYSSTLAGVEYEIRQTRRVLARAGYGRTRLLVSELGVASDASWPTLYDKGEEGQALFLGQALRRLGAEHRRWHLAGVDWFSWQDSPESDRSCSFCQYSGLFDVSGQPKPAWYAFKRVAAAVR
jgi:hypothetical protein